MRWFPKIVALALLGLWLPASAHCLLETLPALNIFDSCCSSETAASQGDACAEDFCGTIESGLYKVEDHSDLAVDAPVALLDSPLADPGLSAPFSFRPRLPIPDPGRQWLFLCRAAPQARAPSSI